MVDRSCIDRYMRLLTVRSITNEIHPKFYGLDAFVMSNSQEIGFNGRQLFYGTGINIFSYEIISIPLCIMVHHNSQNKN